MKSETENRLHFSNEKCSTFSAYRNDPSFIEADYTMDDHVIEKVEEISDLVVLTDKRFRFGNHMETMTINECRLTIGCIKHFSNDNFTKETNFIYGVHEVKVRICVNYL